MKLQLTTIATAKQLAIMTARFQILAAPEIPPDQIKNLTNQLSANLNSRLVALAEHHRLRLRDRPVLTDAAREAYGEEIKRLNHWMIQAPKSLN